MKYKLNDKFTIAIHENIEETKKIIKKNTDLFITSTDFHEYTNKICNEYGPINMLNIISFIKYISKLKIKVNKHIIYYVYNSKNNYDLLNCLFLFGCYFIIRENYSIDKLLYNISYIFEHCPHYYTDCISKYNGYIITIKDCFKTIKFINDNNYLNINKFDIKQYLYFTDYEFRDMTLILNKFLAMSCPSNYNINNLITELNKLEIKNIIRLNGESSYNKKLFENNNIIIHDLYFEDMTTPSLNIIKKFMNIISSYDSAELFAIHCNAGIGRTALLICIYLILKLNFKPINAITYMRIMRPGSIMYQQGIFLESINYFKKYI
jgi:cell division cycle 14